MATKQISRTLLASAVLLTLAAPAQAVVIFSTNFESGLPAAFSGAGTIQSSVGYSAHGFGANFLRNASGGNPAAATALTLTGLPAHTGIDLDFFLAVIDSWDGSPTSPNCCKPDIFNVRIDGVLVFSDEFFNFGTDPGSYTANQIVGPTGNLGYTSDYPDSAYNLGADPVFSIAHTVSSVTIQWFASGAGWQAGTDESWAIDNVNVSLTGTGGGAVPEPASLALLGIGLAGLGAMRRRKA